MNERLRSSVTGQVLAEFFINHLLDLGKQLPDQNDGEVIRLTTTPWQMYFDGSSTQGGAGAGIVFISLNGLVSHHSYRLFFLCTNNVADYEALLIGLELAAAMGMRSIHVNVNKGAEFDEIQIDHVPRRPNVEANTMAQLSSTFEIS